MIPQHYYRSIFFISFRTFLVHIHKFIEESTSYNNNNNNILYLYAYYYNVCCVEFKCLEFELSDEPSMGTWTVTVSLKVVLLTCVRIYVHVHVCMYCITY